MTKMLNNSGRFSIKDLERLSGIKAHTLRIWEKRYGLVEPKRSASNIRSYTNDDLKKVLNVAMLNRSGLKISNIANLSDDELLTRIQEYSITNEGHRHFIDQLVFAMIDMDEELMEELIDKAILEHGFEKTMLDIIHPFFKNVGLMWLTGSVHPGQEHFISNLIRRKLIIAIDRKKQYSISGNNVVFFLPEQEWHELGLLFHSFIALDQKVNTYYLGQSVPISTIEKVIESKKPSHLVFSHLSVKSYEALVKYSKELKSIAGEIKIVFLDNSLSQKQKEKLALIVPESIDHFKEIIS
ncbi:MAG: MerR family transcriptional regulator [Flavobacteriales bacterium]|nr:MerR family transcriptional regulator [Flavobacteriales bacterium]